MRHGSIKSMITISILAGMAHSCGKKSTNDKSKSGGTVAPRILLGGNKTLNTSDRVNSFWDSIHNPLSNNQNIVATAGQTSTLSLKSLKYYVQSIQICQDITRQGSGFSNTQGCITIYSNSDANDQAYQNYDISTAMADTDENHWIDFMSATSRAKLTANPDLSFILRFSIKRMEFAFLYHRLPIERKAEA